eukprot:6458538-Amphidinium_carterae.1
MALAVKSEGTSDAFFEHFSGMEVDIVPVDDPWEELVRLMAKPRGLLLRAPPRFGKTFLGLAASEQCTCPKVLMENNLTVEYFTIISAFLRKYPDPEATSRDTLSFPPVGFKRRLHFVNSWDQ